MNIRIGILSFNFENFKFRRMKRMKKINILLLLLSFAAFISCEKEGDLITISRLEENELTGSASDVVITEDNTEEVVLTLNWTESSLSISDTTMSVPDIVVTTLQASTNEDFTDNVTESTETELSRSFTGAELNTLAKNLGAIPDVSTPVFFRLKALTGNNMEPVYSNAITTNITPFQIDMSIGYILDKDKAETAMTLYSADSDGRYLGFTGAVSWYNFFLREGDGTVWGNDPVSEVPFELSSDEGAWNCWFPGLGGCYYVDFNTNELEWSALHIPSLTVSGDIEGEMTYDRPNNKWILVFDATSSSINITVSGNGKLYNPTTRDDDAAAIDKPVGFTQNSETLEFGEQASTLSINVPSAGESTLVIDLSNPAAWTCEVTAGSGEPEEIIETLYLPGIDDGITGEWTFNNSLHLYDEETMSYAGVVNVNSLWGYNINIEKDNWDDAYFLGEGDAYTGTLSFKEGDNLPSPDPGLYLFDVSLNALSYNLISVGTEIYVSGLDDIWDFSKVLTATDEPGVFSGEVTFEAASPWGFQIHLNDSWNNFYGGADGQLIYKGASITDDAELTPGTYTLNVDLINNTYEFIQ
jgi:CheY-specific phosphatase CheX